MNPKELAQQINQLVSAGETKAVFDLLKKHVTDQKAKKSLAILESEFNELQRTELHGTLSFEEAQRWRNLIHQRLLNFSVDYKDTPVSTRWKLLIIAPLFIILSGVAIWWGVISQHAICPDFSTDFTHRVMIIPFENVGQQTANPQLVLRDRINQLTRKNNLSTGAKIANPIPNMSMDTAAGIAEKCGAELLIWGTYSARNDSLRLVLQYYFHQQPAWSNMGNLIALKDVTGLQNGKMLKDLDDTIFSLCGLIALRSGQVDLAEKWIKKVDQKEVVDRQVLKVLQEK